MGDNAARQPGTLQEAMLHETVVAWARNLMTKSTPAKPWEESPELFGRRLKEAFAFMNDNYNVEGLSRELPDRVQTLVEADGDRLCKQQKGREASVFLSCLCSHRPKKKG